MAVYVDLIFLINFLIDALLIWTTARVRRVRLTGWRCLVSAAIGAGYVLTLFIPALGSWMFTVLIKTAVSLIMVATAFGYGSLQHYLRNLGVFYLLNFTAAGGVIGARYLWQSSEELLQAVSFSRSGGLEFRLQAVGLVTLFVLVAAALALYRLISKGLRRQEALTDFMAEVHIWIENTETVCTGLIDTGNQLYDPLTRTPVMVMQASLWKAFMPESWLSRIERAETEQIITAIGTDEFVWQDRLRLVPYRGINRGTQFMLALKPDRVIVIHGNSTVETERVLVALDGGTLSSDGSYQAIIHPALVQSHAS